MRYAVANTPYISFLHIFSEIKADSYTIVRARYYLAIDYNQESVPPLKPEDALWSDTLLRQQGLKSN